MEMWPVNTGDCLTEVTAWTGLTVLSIFRISASGRFVPECIIRVVIVISTLTSSIYEQSSRQGFQSGPVPGTFTHLRSCIVPAEITETPKISGGQNHRYDGR
jgi:hypothetical protein